LNILEPVELSRALGSRLYLLSAQRNETKKKVSKQFWNRFVSVVFRNVPTALRTS